MINLYGWLLGFSLRIGYRLAAWLFRLACRYPFATVALGWLWLRSAQPTGPPGTDQIVAVLAAALIVEAWRSPGRRTHRHALTAKRRAATARLWSHGRRLAHRFTPMIHARYPEASSRAAAGVATARRTGIPGLWRGMHGTSPSRRSKGML